MSSYHWHTHTFFFFKWKNFCGKVGSKHQYTSLLELLSPKDISITPQGHPGSAIRVSLTHSPHSVCPSCWLSKVLYSFFSNPNQWIGFGWFKHCIWLSFLFFNLNCLLAFSVYFMPFRILKNFSKLSCETAHILDLSYHFLMIQVKMLTEIPHRWC